MNAGKLKAIHCKISRGGFSDERVFTISVGRVSHSGVASRRHMWNSEERPIEKDEPPLGQVIDGFVAARVVRVDEKHALVSVPDGEVIRIPISELIDRPLTLEKHVPV